MSRVRAFTNMDCLILHMRSAKTLIRLRRCAGWSESSLVAQEKMEGKKARSWPTNRSLLCRKCWSSEKKIDQKADVLREKVLPWSVLWSWPKRQNLQTGMCAQRRLRSAWASAQADQSICCALYGKLKTQSFFFDSEDSDQTGRMPRLIWVFAKRTFHFVGFGVRWLVLFYPMKSNSLPSMVNCIRWPYFIYNLIGNFANFYSNQKFYHPTVNVRIRLCWYAGWSGPSLSAYARRHVFAWYDPTL